MSSVSFLFILCFSSFLSFVLSNSGVRELEINFPPTHVTCVFYVAVQSEKKKKKKKKKNRRSIISDLASSSSLSIYSSNTNLGPVMPAPPPTVHDLITISSVLYISRRIYATKPPSSNLRR
jgi:hypothetical protein